MNFLGNFPEDFTTVTCMFTTHQADGAPVAPSTALESADVLIYKNGNGAQKTTTNGITMSSPFDGKTGLHCLTIDTSNDTGDSGFWVAGAVYTIVLEPDETVDSTTVRSVIGQFSIAMGVNANVTSIAADAITHDTFSAASGLKYVRSNNIAADVSGTSVTLDGSASSTDDIYNGMIIHFPFLAVQRSRRIVDYNGTTKVATMDRALGSAALSGETFLIFPAAHGYSTLFDTDAQLASEIADAVWDEPKAAHSTTDTMGQQLRSTADALYWESFRMHSTGTAQAGSTSTITLSSGSSSTTNHYLGNKVLVYFGTGATQSRKITAYDGTTKVATVDYPWSTAPDNTSQYSLWADSIDGATDLATVDTVVDAIKAKTDNLPSDPADASVIAGRFDTLDTAVADLPTNAELATALDALPTAIENASAVLAAAYEGSETFQDFLRLTRAALLGEAAGLATTTVTFRDAADTKNRITATVDSDGNRSAVTLDPS